MAAFFEWSFERFLFFYGQSRPWSSLWKGLPAALCAIAGTSAVVAVHRPNDGVLVSRFEDAAIAANNVQQESAEDLCRRRLLVLQPSDPRTCFEYAAVLARHDENGRAARIMQSLAPLDRTGYAPAHFWLAEQLMKSKAPLSPAEVALLQRRLEFSLVGPNAIPAAHLAMVELAMRTRQWKVAVEHLQELVLRRPDLLMDLAFAYRQLGDEILAMSTAERATAFYAKMVRETPQDDASRLRWSDTLLFQRKLREAIEVLQAADKAETDPRFGAAIAQVFLMRLTSGGTSPSPIDPNAPASALLPANRPVSALELATRVQLLSQALHYGPHHPAVLTAIAQLSTEESPDGEQARIWLKDALASGKAPPTVHLVLGTAAAIKGDLTQAVFHLKQANERDPKLTQAANNLAYVLARTDPPRIEEALRLIDAVVQGMPRHPEFHETRGQILLMLGRTEEAIQELEYVLEKMPNYIEAHAGLATAYRSVGIQELADRHTQITETLKREKAQPKTRR